MEILTQSEEETARAAQDWLMSLTEGALKGLPIFLYGNLGAGKSVFARALIRALTGQPDLEVPSPTFTILQTYDTPHEMIWHYDLYRIETPQEIYELSWEDALFDGIVIVEWPQRLGNLLPSKRLDITFSNIKGHPHHRKIHFKQGES